MITLRRNGSFPVCIRVGFRLRLRFRVWLRIPWICSGLFFLCSPPLCLSPQFQSANTECGGECLYGRIREFVGELCVCASSSCKSLGKTSGYDSTKLLFWKTFFIILASLQLGYGGANFEQSSTYSKKMTGETFVFHAPSRSEHPVHYYTQCVFSFYPCLFRPLI